MGVHRINSLICDRLRLNSPVLHHNKGMHGLSRMQQPQSRDGTIEKFEFHRRKAGIFSFMRFPVIS